MAFFSKRIPALAAAFVLLSLGVACGSDEDTNTDAPTNSTTTTDPMDLDAPVNKGTGAPEDVNPNNPGGDDSAPAETSP